MWNPHNHCCGNGLIKEFYIVTHTEATHHIQGIVGGWYDSELTENGKADAILCAGRLKELGLDGTPVVTSDLKRAIQTGQAISNVLKGTLSLDARLREMSYGEAEGKPQDWLDSRIIPHDNENRLDHSIVIGSETRREFAARLFNVMHELSSSNDKLIICTHGFALTFLIASWIKMPIESVGYVNFKVKPGSVTYLNEDDLFKSRAVVYLGDVRHLNP